MSITDLSTEILQKIFEQSELTDLIHLAQVNRRLYRCFLGRRFPLLERGLHNSYAPLPSLLKLVLAHEPDKTRKPIGTEIRINNQLERIVAAGDNPKLTLEHMKKMVAYGRTAERWTEIYPRLRWRFGSDNRRLLRPYEKERLRRAIYHHWTYTTLFHSRSYTTYSPDPPSPASFDDPRHRLLRTYSTVEHIQLSELLAHIEQLVELDLYPSNSIVQEYYSHTLPPRALAKIAWGEGSEYRRLVRDIMKLGPDDLLHLVESTSTKQERLDFLYAKEACFGDVPATLNYALSTVTVERARCGWGLGVEGGERAQAVERVLFPSLRPKAHDEERDVEDSEVVFGIVDVEKRRALAGLEGKVGCDGVATGEWEVYCARIEEVV